MSIIEECGTASNECIVERPARQPLVIAELWLNEPGNWQESAIGAVLPGMGVVEDRP